MDREADHEQRAERERAGRVGGADRQALAEVVQADADRDEQREVGAAGRPAAGAASPRERMQTSTAEQREVGDDGAEKTSATPPKACEPWPAAISVPSSSASTIEEGEQADRERHQHADHARLERRSDGSQSMPSSTGMTPT